MRAARMNHPGRTERYNEIGPVSVGDGRRFRSQLLALVATLFGDDEAERLEAKLRSW